MTPAPAYLPAAWRHRISAWWKSRIPLTDTLTLNQGNIYIVPTRAGLMFLLTVALLLVASINYQLGLGYLLTFLLAGAGFMSMLITHGTLRGLTLHLRAPASVFAGEPAVLEAVLTAPARGFAGRPGHGRWGIGLSVDDSDAGWAWVDVPAGGQATATVSFVPTGRGLHPVPTLRLQTPFPLGLFRAWTVWRPAAKVLAYPRPETPCAPRHERGRASRAMARRPAGRLVRHRAASVAACCLGDRSRARRRRLRPAARWPRVAAGARRVTPPASARGTRVVELKRCT
jgi:hypothetical protein